jgi:hypothetical protein
MPVSGRDVVTDGADLVLHLRHGVLEFTAEFLDGLFQLLTLPPALTPP